MNRVTLTIELSASGEPPTEFRIFPAGYFDTTKGIFRFDDSSADSVMKKANDWGNDYCIDYDHAMLSFFSLDPSESIRAAGWFRPEVRTGELWATKVTWTDKAASMLKAREIRYTSPAFNAKRDGTITELINCAVTNIPATKNQTPIAASRKRDAGGNPKEKGSMKKLSILILGALGLASDVDDDTVLSALSQLKERARLSDESLKAKTEAEKKLVEAQAQIAKLTDARGDAGGKPSATVSSGEAEAKLNGLTGKKSFGESLGVVLSWKASAEEVDKLNARIVELEVSGRVNLAEALVDQGIREGKIAPVQREMWLSIGKKDPDTIRGFLNTASTVVPKNPFKELEKAPAPPLTPEQKKAAEKLGLRDPKTLEGISESMATAAFDPTRRGRVELMTTKPPETKPAA